MVVKTGRLTQKSARDIGVVLRVLRERTSRCCKCRLVLGVLGVLGVLRVLRVLRALRVLRVLVMSSVPLLKMSRTICSSALWRQHPQHDPALVAPSALQLASP
jgi:hypothetical protein